MGTKEFYNNLVQSLRLAASPYEIQITSMPAFVEIPDEIALLFSDAYLMAPNLQEDGMISSQALIMLNELEKELNEMSEDKSLWTLESLQKNSLWSKIRGIARTILTELKEPYDKPNLDFVDWVK